jgi:hypothetical protein
VSAFVRARSAALGFLTDDRDATATFTALRLGTAAVILVKSLVELPFITTIYGDGGVLPWAVSDHATISIFPRLSIVAGLLGRVGASADQALYVVFGCYLVAVVAMLVRVDLRLPAFCAWFLHLMFFAVSFKSVYGLDCFLNIALFYCLIGPNGSFGSLAAPAPAERPRRVSDALILRLLQLNVCLVYASAAVAKGRGADWWDGESIWRAVAQPQFTGIVPMLWLHAYPMIATVAGWATLATEGAFPILVWFRPTRRVALIAIVAMHLSIALILNLKLFSAIMIVLDIAAFGQPEVRLAVNRLRRFGGFRRPLRAPAG